MSQPVNVYIETPILPLDGLFKDKGPDGRTLCGSFCHFIKKKREPMDHALFVFRLIGWFAGAWLLALGAFFVQIRHYSGHTLGENVTALVVGILTVTSYFLELFFCTYPTFYPLGSSRALVVTEITLQSINIGLTAVAIGFSFSFWLQRDTFLFLIPYISNFLCAIGIVVCDVMVTNRDKALILEQREQDAAEAAQIYRNCL